MTRFKWLILATAVVVIASAGAGLLSARASGNDMSTKSTADLSTPGRVTPTPLMSAVLKRTQTDDGALTRLGASHDATFYRITGSAEHGDCFAVGLGQATSATINLIACGETPSKERPVVDSSVFDTTDASTTYNQLIGWTSPDVKTITLLDSSGTPLASVPSEAGFYYLPRDLMPKNGVQLNALNATGDIVWSGGAK